MESDAAPFYKRTMFRLAHVSDVHLGPLPEVGYRQLVSKRAVGYINWHRNRRLSLHDGIVQAIMDDIKAAAVDHLAVTGDLVNLAMDGEIETARTWLETLGDPKDVSVVPGNHDAYVPGAFERARRSWSAWMTGDAGVHAEGLHFPYLRVRGPVAVIGTSSARATAPFMASGYFREPQALRTIKLLEETGRQGLFRVVMIHHPPVRDAVQQQKRLLGIGRFQNMVQRYGAELVLHGHSHLPTLHWIAGARTSVPVVGVAATGQAPGGSHPAAQWNLLEITGKPGAWALRLTRRGFTPEKVLAEISATDLIGPTAKPWQTFSAPSSH